MRQNRKILNQFDFNFKFFATESGKLNLKLAIKMQELEMRRQLVEEEEGEQERKAKKGALVTDDIHSQSFSVRDKSPINCKSEKELFLTGPKA